MVGYLVVAEAIQKYPSAQSGKAVASTFIASSGQALPAGHATHSEALIFEVGEAAATNGPE